MPQFHIDLGSSEGAIQFTALDAFTRGYIEALFFTDASDPDDGDLADATFAELAPDTLAKIIHDCELFQRDNADGLDAAYETSGYGEESAGVDFWLTRNHHGAGFWDRDLGAAGDALTQAAHGYTSRDVYRGDDGLVYLS